MRASGILMHISSLPEKHGIGTFGREAYGFVDFLQRAGQRYWQVLPMGPTDYGNSPYQSSSVFAGNPYFIDLDFLRKDGLLNREEYAGSWGDSAERVDFEAMKARRLPVLYKAYQRFQKNGAYHRFCRENALWLEDYTLYTALREKLGVPWLQWPEPLKKREPHALAQARRQLSDRVDFYRFVQFKFFEQWKHLKGYANSKGVEIIGDIPIYTAMDSADTWSHPELFQLKRNYDPAAVSGVPPDAFSATGQLWGNPLYRWDRMKRDHYRWWVERIRATRNLFDVIRIDHFRGLESYYSIPAGDTTAERGHWEKGPGSRLFQEIKKQLGPVDFIAEDLGMLTPEVHQLRKRVGLPGMRILQFAFSLSEESTYLPHNCEKDSVVYTGTHDNNTALGWYDSLDPEEQAFVLAYLGLRNREDVSWGLVRGAWMTTADLAIAQMQDLLDLPGESRMNTPATVGGNWEWRMAPGALDDEIPERLESMTKLYFRQSKKA